MIRAKPPGMIQFEASRTDALEAAQSVNTLTGFWANSRLIAFVNIWNRKLQEIDEKSLFSETFRNRMIQGWKRHVTMTRVPLLVVAHLAATSVASRSVDAILLTQVISGRAFIQVSAANTVGVQDET